MCQKDTFGPKEKDTFGHRCPDLNQNVKSNVFTESYETVRAVVSGIYIRVI